MSQHDMNIANQGFPAFRADLNDALAALASTSTGATEPSTTFAQQLWYDSTANLLKMRNTDNDAWITLAYFDQTNDEWEIRSAVIQAVDSAGVVIKTDDGTTRLTIADDGSITTQGDLTVGGDLDVSSGTIKLDGNYPVGTANVALGDTALDTLASGSYNTALGGLSLTSNVSSSSNTAAGAWALKDTTGSANTAVGAFSAYQNTTGVNNVAIGASAFEDNTTGSNNTALGASALGNNTTASNNTAVGLNALYENTTGTRNTAVGYNAGLDNTTNSYNTYIGYIAGQNATGETNTFVGDATGYDQTSGNGNTYIGQQAGNAMTTGSKNTILGRYNGNQGGLDIRTSSNNIVLSDGDGNPRQFIDSSGRVLINRPNSIGAFGQLLEIGEGNIDGVAGLAMHSRVDIADDATLTLTGAVNTALVLFVTYFNGGGNLPAAMFLASYQGTCQLISNDAGSFAVSDLDNNACVFKSAGSVDITIKNRLGSSRPYSVYIMHLRGQ